MATQTKNLNLSVFDFATDSTPDFVKGVAGLQDSNMHKIDEAITNKIKLGGEPTSINLIEENGVISKINNRSVLMSTDLIKTPIGVTDEERHTELLKTLGKEFTSNGEDIVVDNAIPKQKVVSAKIEGLTVKNEIKTPKFDSKDLFTMSYMTLPIKDGEATVELDGTNRSLVFIGCDCESENGTDIYYASMDLKIISHVESTYYLSLSTFGGGYDKVLCNFNDCKIGEYTKQSIVTSNANWKDKRLGLKIGGSKNAECSYSFKNPVVINLTKMFGKGKEPTKEQCDILFNGFLDFGLNSTKEVIRNNEKEYKFYNPIIKGKTKVMKAPKGTQNWIEINLYEVRDADTYDYKLEADEKGLNGFFDVYDYIDLDRKVKVINIGEYTFNGTENWLMWGGSYYSYTSSISKNGTQSISTWLNSDVFGQSTTTAWVRVDNGVTRISLEAVNETPQKLKEKLAQNPLTIRYKLEQPIEIPLTEEEIAQYENPKKLYRLNGFGTACDTLEILENGLGIHTQKVYFGEMLYANSFAYKEANSNEETLYFECYLLNKMKNGTQNVLCSHLERKNIQSKDSTEEGFTIVYYTLYFRISKSKLKTPDLHGFKMWLEENNVYLLYELNNPIVTNIPKESMFGVIPTYENNSFSFGEEIKPSKATVNIPISKIEDLETRLSQLEKVITSTSNLSLLSNYVEDEYNKEINQL